MAKKRSKNGINLDIEQLKRLEYAFNVLGEEFPERVVGVAQTWASKTESIYRTKVKYGDGFRRVNPRYRDLTAYSDADQTNTGFQAEVGHECFIARFLEVGTRAHEIREGHKVGGIHGTHALKKVVDDQLDNLYSDIGEFVDKELSDN